MRCLLVFLCLLCFFLPAARGEGLEESLSSALDSLPLFPWEDAWQALIPEGGELKEALLSLARGERKMDGEALLLSLGQMLFSQIAASAHRCAQLMIPAVFCGVLQKMKAAFAKGALGEYAGAACYLLLASVMARDLAIHMQLSRQAVTRMADLMQALFPLLLTLLAAVGGTAGAAFFQPAVVAACGTMTALVRNVTLPLAMAASLTAMLNHLSRHMQVGKLSALLKSAASWTLGVSFTMFISVNALQSLGAAAADGISIRTAKYAVDHFVPVVGGMFADTMDTLVGASLLIKNALGLTGLMLLLSTAAGPMLQTLGTVIVYRACAALLEPVADEKICACIQDFSDMLMLFFIIQLSVGAMFLLLVAQMLAAGNLTVMLR